MTAATDGLADLEERRTTRRRRQPPPPRHPRPVDATTPSEQETPTPTGREDAPYATPAAPPSAPPALSPQPSPPTPLRAAQFYIDGDSDEYLRQVRAEALARRLDVTASAVVRLALHRLMRELNSQEVAAQLAEPPAWQHGVGRRRR
jgi:hypothetical protein